tara:strand:+ start:13 stop:189 length:177 start_codon:yes stop_codon:yes gene_type:complete
MASITVWEYRSMASLESVNGGCDVFIRLGSFSVQKYGFVTGKKKKARPFYTEKRIFKE